MAIEKLLKSNYSRKVFYFISTLFLGSLIIIRFFVFPQFNVEVGTASIINNILDSLVSTWITTVLIASILFWLTPRVVQESQMDVVEPRQIEELLTLARDSDEYWYSGNTARYTRTVTLPELARRAEASNFTRRIKIQILDPTNDETLISYVNYRNRVRSGKKDPWTLDRVRIEILATILYIYLLKKTVPLLEVELGFKNSVSFFRIDLSKKVAVITKEDSREPALKCDSGTFFFNSYLEELRYNLNTSKKLDTTVKGISYDELNNLPVIQDLLNKLGIDITIDTKMLDGIRESILEAKNPYA